MDLGDVTLDFALRDCRSRGIDATGTAHVLERRSTRLERQLKFLTFVGLAVPVVVGGLVLGYGAGFKALGLVIAAAAGLIVLQLVVSTWAMTAGWVDGQAMALRSAIRNRELARSLRRVAQELVADSPGAALEYKHVTGRDDGQQDNDYALGFTPAETRAAHQAGLRQYQEECAGCGQKPTTLDEAIECGVCGDFVWRWWGGYRPRKRSRSSHSVPSTRRAGPCP